MRPVYTALWNRLRGGCGMGLGAEACCWGSAALYSVRQARRKGVIPAVLTSPPHLVVSIDGIPERHRTVFGQLEQGAHQPPSKMCLLLPPTLGPQQGKAFHLRQWHHYLSVTFHLAGASFPAGAYLRLLAARSQLLFDAAHMCSASTVRCDHHCMHGTCTWRACLRLSRWVSHSLRVKQKACFGTLSPSSTRISETQHTYT